jgi:nucleotide-binding universal stress UspA family protein
MPAIYENLLIGVDGRQGGVDAAALAAVLAAPAARRHLVFVAGAAAHTGRGSVGDLHLELADSDCLDELMGRERRLVGERATVMCFTADTVADGLRAAAMQCESDLVVVGASRRGGIPHVTRDEDALAVIHHTAETVAVAPVGFADRAFRLDRIGVAFDGSDESMVALAHGGLLAEQRGCELMVVTVEDSDHLVACTDEVDLLVCGSRRNGPLRRLLAGSASDHLVRHVEAPLIITAPVDSATVVRWRERHPEAGAHGAR